ncbi:hypothetical protein PRIPAC_74399 [Pristionchus pacificus]|uniref:Uncharacterized protein n=1 Tax=Pristionchus pacificus TaxID=54126 RepID=A0A2A6C801_PRIPA|nr:hypothetical protein PRIPAC_74399 [Pristionchus pacificus]|eukprot:PDM74342.1 hypothetical protein PRIPAC_41698 [Pristionchus pacificus]
MGLLIDILDYGLLTINLYVLLRIRLSKEEAFKTPFFYWFFMTGMASSLSVVGFIIAVRFLFPVEYSWGFKFGYMLNSATITFATIGKTLIAFHRWSVMRTTTFIEDIWSPRVTYILTAISTFLSFGACTPVFWCGMTYKVVGNVTVVLYIDDACNVTQKSRSSAVYFLYVIFSVVMTVLTSREFIKLSKLAEDSTKALIMSNQRNMFIIVSICTITQMVKATHQFCWVFVAAFGATDLNLFLQKTYDVTHYLATYSATASLVIFNKKVRRLMYSTRIRAPQASSQANVYVLLRIQISREDAFRTPFFYSFLITGLASSLSVVGFIVADRFTFIVENEWGFKYGYMLNAFSVTFSTIGKTSISMHRYAMMRTFIEDIWSRKIWSRKMSSYILTLITSIVSLAACSPAFWCGLTYTMRDNVTVVVYLDDACTVGSTRALISSNQRNMFIIVSIYTVTQMIKATHQYDVTHYLSTYSVIP